MEWRDFMAICHGFRNWEGRSRSALIVGACLFVLAGCAGGPQKQAAPPRDLVPDVSVQADRPAAAGITTIGVLLPMTGPAAEVGSQLWQAAVLSLFEEGHEDIVLVPYDTEGTPAGAIAAANRAAANGTRVVIGPLFSSSVSATRPILAAYGMRGIALSNNSAEAGEPYFMIGNHPETQIDALAEYLNSEGRVRVKLLGPNTPYLQLLQQRLDLLDKAGRIQFVDSQLYKTSASYTEISKAVQTITLYDRRSKALREFSAIFEEAWEKFEDPNEALDAAVSKLGEQMEEARLSQASFALDAPVGAPVDVPSQPRRWAVSEQEYEQALSDFLDIYRKQLNATETPDDALEETVEEFEFRETLGKADFDAVILPVGDKPLLVIAPMFEYFNATQPDVWLLGTSVWQSAARSAPSDLREGRFITESGPNWSEFRSRYERSYGRQPDPLAVASYDAVRVAVAEKRETGRVSFDSLFLTRSQGFEGVNGTFRFLPSGTNQREQNVAKVARSGPQTVFTWNPDRAFPETQFFTPLPGDKSVPLPVEKPIIGQPPPLSAVDRPSEKRG